MRTRLLIAAVAIAVAAGAGTVVHSRGITVPGVTRQASGSPAPVSERCTKVAAAAKVQVKAAQDAIAAYQVQHPGVNPLADHDPTAITTFRVWAQILSDDPDCFEPRLVASARQFLAQQGVG